MQTELTKAEAEELKRMIDVLGEKKASDACLVSRSTLSRALARQRLQRSTALCVRGAIESWQAERRIERERGAACSGGNAALGRSTFFNAMAQMVP